MKTIYPRHKTNYMSRRMQQRHEEYFPHTVVSWFRQHSKKMHFNTGTALPISSPFPFWGTTYRGVFRTISPVPKHLTPCVPRTLLRREHWQLPHEAHDSSCGTNFIPPSRGRLFCSSIVSTPETLINFSFLCAEISHKERSRLVLLLPFPAMG